MRWLLSLGLFFSLQLFASETLSISSSWSEICHGEALDSSIKVDSTNDNTFVITTDVSAKKEKIGSQRTQCSFDSNRNLQEVIRGFGNSYARATKFQYDVDGRIIRVTHPSGDEVYYTYDSDGLLLEIQSSDHSVHYALEYDNFGNVTEAVNCLNGERVQRHWDEFGRLEKEIFPNGRSLKFTYASDSKFLTNIDMGESGYISYQLVDQGGFNVSRCAASGEVLYDHTYQINSEKELIIERLPYGFGYARTQVSPKKCEYQRYNSKSRYGIRACHDTVIRQCNESAKIYDLDDRGYLSAGVDLDSLGNPTGAEVNDFNELLTLGEIRCKYDLNGNLIEKRSPRGTYCYQYDALNRLIAVTTPKSQLSFTYDAFNRRMTKRVDSRGKCRTEGYIYAWESEIGVTSGTGGLVALRVPGLSIHANVVSPIAIESHGQVYLPEYDSSFNLQKLVEFDSGKELVFNVDPFGKSLLSGHCEVPWVFQSKHFDAESGLIYFGHRYYDPEVTRWTSPDPLGPIDGMNPYLFAKGNPLQYVDVDGRFVIVIPLTSGAIAMIKAVVVGSAAATAAKIANDKIKKHQEQKERERWERERQEQEQKAKEERAREIEERRKRFPQRKLPRDKYGNPVPDADAPHTQMGVQSGRKGDYAQAREFDGHGREVRTIDFTDHGRPTQHPYPHQHRPEPNSSGGTPGKGKPEPF